MKKSLGAKIAVPTAPVWVVGTYDREGKPNAMAVSWGGVCCSRPPCLCISLRKATQTYGNVMRRRAFTVSVPSEAHAREADYFGIESGKRADKFAATGLTPVRSELVDAPYVGEFPLALECRVIRVVRIGLHTQFIGEIVDAKADPSVLGRKKFPEIAKLNPIVWNVGGGYHAVGKWVGEAFSIGEAFKKPARKAVE